MMAVAGEAGVEEMAGQLVSAEVVGNAFVKQYYHVVNHYPELAYRFYQDSSKLGRPEDDGSISITTTMQAIEENFLSLNHEEFVAEILSVDAQESLNSGVHVLVTGYLTGKDNIKRSFVQSFFLAPQNPGYFVLNDMFRYIEKVKHNDINNDSVNDVQVPVTLEQEAAPVQEVHNSELTNASTEEANGEEVYNPSENGETTAVEEEVPVDEVVDEESEDVPRIVESTIKTEETSKKSYASIVMDLKNNVLPFSPPPPALRKSPRKSPDQQVNTVPPVADMSSSLDVAESGNNHQEGETDGYSIYIKGLPYNATTSLLHDEFKRFGPIKDGGIQVRSKQGFCFGFVEFEVANAVEKAIEASPITLGERQVIVEEKKSTYSRVNTRGRFSAGRGPAFRNDGMRGRGNYGSGRGGYSRGEFYNRTEFGNRGNNRGGSFRGGDVYQRTENAGNIGNRINRVNGIANSGDDKNMAQRVPPTA